MYTHLYIHNLAVARELTKLKNYGWGLGVWGVGFKFALPRAKTKSKG